jgi:DNA-binding LytR/AlgR family response regulator
VDDEAIPRQATIRIIKRVNNVNVNIIEAEDGLKLLNLVYEFMSRDRHIDCIFTDESMTYMNGTQTAEIINKFLICKKNIKIPIYLITGYNESYLEKSEYIEKILSKPIRKESIEGIINGLLDSRGIPSSL